MLCTKGFTHSVLVKLLKNKGLSKDEAESILLIEVYGITPSDKRDILFEARKNKINIDISINNILLKKQCSYYVKLLEDYYDSLCEDYKSIYSKQSLMLDMDS